MLHIIITSYKEPKSTIRAIKAFLQQDIKTDYKIIIVDPFEKTEEILKKEFEKEFKSELIEFFFDPGEGKSYALNILFEQIWSKPDDIIISTDGDVFVGKNSVNKILNAFKNKKVGCATGKPVPLDSKKTFFGYLSHLAFEGIHNVRKKLSKQNKFFELSGYLFAIRNGVLEGFPLETSEDSIIPYLFWEKGYKIDYVDAKVYVKNPGNLKDYLTQKIRNIKAHENLNNLAPGMPRTKSLANEIKHGFFFALTYPRNLREFFYTFLAYPLRLYIYLKAFYELKFRKQSYSDGWRVNQTESTKTLD